MKILRTVCNVAFWVGGEICCHLWRYAYWWIVCSVVYHDGSDGSWSFCLLRNGGMMICRTIWIDSYSDCGGCCFCSCDRGVWIKSDCIWIFDVRVVSGSSDCCIWRMTSGSCHCIQASGMLACLMAEFYLGNP